MGKSKEKNHKDKHPQRQNLPSQSHPYALRPRQGRVQDNDTANIGDHPERKSDMIVKKVKYLSH